VIGRHQPAAGTSRPRAVICAHVRASDGADVFRLRAAYFANRSWVVARFIFSVLSHFKPLAAAPEPRSIPSITASVPGVEWGEGPCLSSHARLHRRARDMISYWIALALSRAHLRRCTYFVLPGAPRPGAGGDPRS